MNKKKVGIIVGIVLVLLLAIYLAFNPTWITHPKYMLDKQYCEQDSDCIKGCSAINKYNSKNIFVNKKCDLFEWCGLTCNKEINKCKFVECPLVEVSK